MSEKYITMSDAQYILSINLILVPFIRLKISRAMAIYGYSFERMKALTTL
ncbi:hypothetical protein ACVYBP_04880 [Acinetobacter baumannii]|nr:MULTISPECIES: hypothetical protein [Acinetobacter]DAI74966.1 MAG TPA: hypothetical protein [Caudoviricetes sp.]EKZ2481247.1 hypothetical protein [Acinetobacter baumannii]ELA8721770.1 hypothetical protein [Acinetobacter baumannii]ELN3961589.1 hypothetical protein [Acinetobacter baumannii]MBD0467879.1 hypothetical protein [Acinetobacter baumannii]